MYILSERKYNMITAHSFTNITDNVDTSLTRKTVKELNDEIK